MSVDENAVPPAHAEMKEGKGELEDLVKFVGLQISNLVEKVLDEHYKDKKLPDGRALRPEPIAIVTNLLSMTMQFETLLNSKTLEIAFKALNMCADTEWSKRLK